MSEFRKQKDCPSSYDLVDVANGQLNGELGLRIAAHLAECEFCVAEVELYQHFPPAENETGTPPIPHPLRELAEALITHDTVHIKTLERLLGKFDVEVL
jgi:hypothetical protein